MDLNINHKKYLCSISWRLYWFRFSVWSCKTFR